ncbi:hypothetical protein [Luteimonas terricola]|uniref:Transglycosylase SLT domain-containing protein n=1 Tax=Luteimonas terricola TaxID=645597 RepID=A0ABQ2EDZ3_9GAMM|nr:hypothetical protein [Luteimonas terricola]GGK07000.1 hypothetical protein GCM10011394_15290 [Luteimonas terricola]
MIRKQHLGALVLALGLGLASGAAMAQTIGYNVRTGDVWVDARLGEINDYGRRYRDPFIGEISGHYGAPRSLLVELLDRRHWAPADVYYACAIAHALGIPCLDVVREYDRNPGQGWGAVAKRMGIKPGSDAFHALKRGTVGTYERWGHPVVIDRAVRVDWSRPGNGNRGHGDRPGNSRGNGGNDDNRGNNGNRGNKGNRGDKGKGRGNNARGN